MKLTKIVLLLSLFSLSVQAQVLNNKNPKDFQQFKADYADMIDLANESRMPHRIFYSTASSGNDAEWFDAIKQGDLQKVKDLVAKGQDIEAKDTGSREQTALGWAAFIGYEDIVDYLISQNANLWATDTADVSNVFKAATLGKNSKVAETLYNLMKDKIDLNDQTIDSEGETYAMFAASNNRIEVMKFLIKQGVDLNLVTTDKDISKLTYDQSALSFACQLASPEMQKLLIDNGAINHRSAKPSC